MTSNTFMSLGVPGRVSARHFAAEESEEPFPHPNSHHSRRDPRGLDDVLGRGQTGSGKTLAFGLPLLLKMRDRARRPKRPGGLVLVPAGTGPAEVESALALLGQRIDVSLAVVVGGRPAAPADQRPCDPVWTSWWPPQAA